MTQDGNGKSDAVVATRHLDTDIRVRTATEKDFESLARLLRLIDRRKNESVLTAQELNHFVGLFPHRIWEETSVAEVCSELCGIAWERVHLLAVHPQWRRQGIGSALLEASTELAKSREQKCYVLAALCENQESVQFLVKRGFALDRSWVAIGGQISDWKYDRNFPSIVLRQFRPGTDEAELQRVFHETFTEHTAAGGQPAHFHHANANSCQADWQTALALRGNEVVGFCQYRPLNRFCGEITMQAVLRGERGRGTAFALFSWALKSMAREGMQRWVASIDGNNRGSIRPLLRVGSVLKAWERYSRSLTA